MFLLNTVLGSFNLLSITSIAKAYVLVIVEIDRLRNVEAVGQQHHFTPRKSRQCHYRPQTEQVTFTVPVTLHIELNGES